MMREFEKRIVIESHFNHGHSAAQIWKHVKYLPISRTTVYRHVQRLRVGGDSTRKLGSGGKISEASRVATRKITDRLRRNPAVTEKISREIKFLKQQLRTLQERT